MQFRIGIVEPPDAHQQILIGIGQHRGRIVADPIVAAQDQRHRDGKRERPAVPARQQRQQPVEPAIAQFERFGTAGFQNILPVEMRSLAIG